MEQIEVLNRLYGPVCNQCNKIQNHLKSYGYVTKKGFIIIIPLEIKVAIGLQSSIQFQ